MTADLFHPGHVAFLRAARSLGDRLVVHVLDDKFVSSIKPPPIMTQAERLAVVGACSHVDEVHSTGPRKITRSFMRDQGYATYAMGYSNEQEAASKLANCDDLPKSMISVISYTHGISSTILRNRIIARYRASQ